MLFILYKVLCIYTQESPIMTIRSFHKTYFMIQKIGLLQHSM